MDTAVGEGQGQAIEAQGGGDHTTLCPIEQHSPDGCVACARPRIAGQGATLQPLRQDMRYVCDAFGLLDSEVAWQTGR